MLRLGATANDHPLRRTGLQSSPGATSPDTVGEAPARNAPTLRTANSAGAGWQADVVREPSADGPVVRQVSPLTVRSATATPW